MEKDLSTIFIEETTIKKLFDTNININLLLIYILITVFFDISFAQSLTNIDLPGSITIAGIRSSDSGIIIRYTIEENLSSLGASGFTIYNISNQKESLPILRFSMLPDDEYRIFNEYKSIVIKDGPEEAIINQYISPKLRLVGYFPAADRLLLNQDGFLYAIYDGITMFEINYEYASSLPVWEGGKKGNDAYIEGFKLYDFHGIRTQHIYELSNPGKPNLITTTNDFQIQYHYSRWNHEEFNFEGCENLPIHPVLAQAGNNDEMYDRYDIFDGDYRDRINDQLKVDENIGYLSHYIVGFRMFMSQNLNNLILVFDSLAANTDDFNKSEIFGIYPSFESDQLYIFDQSGIYIFSRLATKFDYVHKIKNIQPILLSSKNYPNPFNHRTTIEFELNDKAHVSLKIFNALGEEIETLVHEILTKGKYNKVWDANNVASGTYFYQLNINTNPQKTSNSTSSIKRIVLIK